VVTLDRRAAATLGCCLLLVVAGCAGLSDPGGEPRETAAGATEPPPGLAADGVTDVSALVGAHTAALSATSFTVETTRTTRSPNGSYEVVANATWRVVPGDPVRGAYSRTVATSGDVPDRMGRLPDAVAAYREGDVTYRRVRNDTGTHYRRADLLNTSVRLNPALQRRSIARLGERDPTSVTVEPVTRDGRRRYLVSARLNGTRFRSNATLRLLVTPEGVVREVRTTSTVEFRSGTREVTRTTRITDVGSTTVDRPEWYATAVEATDDG
jgi:hypothetical protein